MSLIITVSLLIIFLHTMYLLMKYINLLDVILIVWVGLSFFFNLFIIIYFFKLFTYLNLKKLNFLGKKKIKYNINEFNKKMENKNLKKYSKF